MTKNVKRKRGVNWRCAIHALYNDKKVHWFSATMTMIIITCLSTNHLIQEYIAIAICMIRYRNFDQFRTFDIKFLSFSFRIGL